MGVPRISWADNDASADIIDAPVDEPLSSDRIPIPEDNAAVKTEYAQQKQLDPAVDRWFSIEYLANLRSVLDYSEFVRTPQPAFAAANFLPERNGSIEGNGEIAARMGRVLFTKIDGRAQLQASPPNQKIVGPGPWGDFARLNEAFAEVSVGDSLTFLAGKYRRVFGPGIFANPMDRHNPVRFMPGSSQQREGALLSQASLTVDTGFDLLPTAIVSAGFLPRLFTDDWGMPTRSRSHVGLGATSVPEQVTDRWTNADLGGFARLYADVAGGDCNAVVYRYERQWQGGMSYARYAGELLEFHGEGLLYQKPHPGGTRDETMLVDVLGGLRFEPLSSSGIVAEYVYRGDRPRVWPANPTEQFDLFQGMLARQSVELGLPPLRHAAAISAYALGIKDRYSIYANVIGNPQDKGLMFALRLEQLVGATAKIALGTSFLGGSDSSFYRRFMPFDRRYTGELVVYF